jgi:hypothetical protein
VKRSGTRVGRGGAACAFVLKFAFCVKITQRARFLPADSRREKIIFRHRYGRHMHRSPSFSLCAEIAQASYFLPAKLPNESVMVISDCAQGGAIRSNKCAIILSDSKGNRLSAGKRLPDDTDEHGRKLPKTDGAA